MSQILEFLRGKKTYIVAILIAVVNTLVTQDVIHLDANTLDLINAILAAAGLGTLRSAVSSVK